MRGLTIAGLILLLAAATAGAQSAPGGPEQIGPVELRGYGMIAAEVYRATGPDGAAVSVARVTCESTEKAALLQAKYLSDLCALPGVSAQNLRHAGRNLPAVRVRDQGWIVACTRAESVLVFASASQVALLDMLEKRVAQPGEWNFRASAEVPAYLDKWDRHGFNFYHRTWEHPNPQNQPWLAEQGYDFQAPYDFDTEFEWARENAVGLVHWGREHMHDRAAGVLDFAWTDWAIQGCRGYGLTFQTQPTISEGAAWWANRYRDEIQAKMPGFVGSYHSIADSYHGGVGYMSWCSEQGKDMQLALTQQYNARYAEDPLLITIMEPHCEVAHGDYDILLEYGPLADRSFRRFLQEERGLSLGQVGARYGRDLGSWDEVRVPEVASFMGWGPEALDLTGVWRVQHASLEEGREQGLSAPDLDTSAWGELLAPGHDHQMFVAKQPAWFRRSFNVPQEWLGQRGEGPVYLYLWDLNRRTARAPVVVYLNGELIGEHVREAGIGLTVMDLAGRLQAGENTLAVHLPSGYLAYRVYLSDHAPRSYPYLGRERNAEWVDFRDWVVWTRVESVRRGMEAIRGVHADLPINLAAPDAIADLAKELAVEYGGFFHNTGYMSAFYADYHARMMRSVGLPSSAEPGGPAGDLPTLKSYWWKVLMAGLNGYNYFIHIGSVMWHPEQKRWFEEQQPMVHLLGKYHLPETRVAALNSPRIDRLVGWPWSRDRQSVPPQGFWLSNVSGRLPLPADILTDRDVMRGALDRYDVVVDEMTSIMSEELVDRISEWVERGGTFVTLVHSGRHSETEPDTWPISRLTGFDMLWQSRVFEDGHSENFRLRLEPEQQVFDAGYWAPPGDPEVFTDEAPWPGRWGNGIGMRERLPECEVLMRWEHDGTVAVGRRPLGQGQVFAVGVKFFHDRFWWGDRQHQDKFMNDLMAWCGIENEKDPRVNGTYIGGGAALHDGPVGRWFVSNNGLYDVYLICNQGQEAADLALSVAADDGPAPWAWDVLGERELPGRVAEGRVSFPALSLEPQDLRGVLVPRMEIAEAPAAWLRLQAGWWQGTAPGRVLEADTWDYVLDLSEDWQFGFMEAIDPAAASRVGGGFPGGRNLPLGAWKYSVPDPPQNGTFRREFTVPAEWIDGEVYLHVSSFFASTFVQTGRVWLNGELLRDWHPDRIERRLTEVLRPGTRHALVIEVQGTPYMGAVRGSVFLEYEPRPQEEVTLTGDWEISPEGLHWTGPVTLPGVWEGRMARRKLMLPQDWQGRTVMLHAVTESGPPILGAVINGKILRRHHHIFGPRLDLNVTPYLRFGGENEIEIVANSAGAVNLTELSLRAYAPERGYP